MYPKVKVTVRREEEDADRYALELSSLQSLKGFENLSPYDSSLDESQTSTVRIPNSFISSSTEPEVPISKGANMNENEIGSEQIRRKIRCNSVLRPRAVLSSPDNDAIIGGRNKTRELHSCLKSHNVCQNRHTQCKVITRPVTAESPVNTRRKPQGAGDSKNDLWTRGRSIVGNQSREASHHRRTPEYSRSKALSNSTMKNSYS